jgi:hypothetical protein
MTALTNLADAQANPEVIINENFDSVSLAAMFGRRHPATTGLTWAYYGTDTWPVNGVPTAVADGTVTLTGSATNYVEVSIAGVVSVSATRSPDKAPLYKVTTSASAITSAVDERNHGQLRRLAYGRDVLAMGDANKTLTQPQALLDSLECTGALTALRDVVVPAVRRQWVVFANVTGGFGVRVKTSGGTGITVADGKRAILECDGTNVVRVTADA